MSNVGEFENDWGFSLKLGINVGFLSIRIVSVVKKPPLSFIGNSEIDLFVQVDIV